MIELTLVHILVAIIVFACLFAVIRLVLPGMGAPEWAVQAAYVIVCAMLVIYLLYALLPFLHPV